MWEWPFSCLIRLTPCLLPMPRLTIIVHSYAFGIQEYNNQAASSLKVMEQAVHDKGTQTECALHNSQGELHRNTEGVEFWCHPRGIDHLSCLYLSHLDNMIQHLVREVERMSKDLDKVKDELYVMQKDQKVPYEPTNVVLFERNKKKGERNGKTGSPQTNCNTHPFFWFFMVGCAAFA